MIPLALAGFILTIPLATKVPLLEQVINTGLTRSARNQWNPARFNDYLPTSKVPSQLSCQFLMKKQQLEAAKARADTA